MMMSASMLVTAILATGFRIDHGPRGRRASVRLRVRFTELIEFLPVDLARLADLDALQRAGEVEILAAHAARVAGDPSLAVGFGAIEVDGNLRLERQQLRIQ